MADGLSIGQAPRRSSASVAIVHLARAAHVSSSALRTAIFSVITGSIIVVMTFRANLGVDIPELAQQHGAAVHTARRELQRHLGQRARDDGRVGRPLPNPALLAPPGEAPDR